MSSRSFGFGNDHPSARPRNRSSRGSRARTATAGHGAPRSTRNVATRSAAREEHETRGEQTGRALRSTDEHEHAERADDEIDPDHDGDEASAVEPASSPGSTATRHTSTLVAVPMSDRVDHHAQHGPHERLAADGAGDPGGEQSGTRAWRRSRRRPASRTCRARSRSPAAPARHPRPRRRLRGIDANPGRRRRCAASPATRRHRRRPDRRSPSTPNRRPRPRCTIAIAHAATAPIDEHHDDRRRARRIRVDGTRRCARWSWVRPRMHRHRGPIA